MPSIQGLSGMRDEGPQERGRRESVQDSLRAVLSSYGYQAIDTPLLEPTELFLRKTGGELASRMYTFTDPGGNRVSLRPEFTASAMRYYLERGVAEPLPLRLQYCGPVFRYGEAKGHDQFHQVGAEFIGSAAPEADGEVLALAWEGVNLLEIPSIRCMVGHVGVVHRMLGALGLSQRARAFMVASLPRLRQAPDEKERIREQAQALGLVALGDSVRGSHPSLEDLGDEKALELLQDLYHGSLTGLLGSRSTKEILSRFMRKLRQGDDPQRVDRGISLLSRLASISAEEEQALPQLRSVAQEFGLASGVLGPLEEVMGSFHQRCPSVSLTIDMGLVRGLAYYTGMVFEIVAQGPGGPLALCGGGRYDGLIKALGGDRDVPALGFAYSVETLLDLLPGKTEGRYLTSSYPQRR